MMLTQCTVLRIGELTSGSLFTEDIIPVHVKDSTTEKKSIILQIQMW